MPDSDKKPSTLVIPLEDVVATLVPIGVLGGITDLIRYLASSCFVSFILPIGRRMVAEESSYSSATILLPKIIKHDDLKYIWLW
jgi:hypothetical protein